MRLSVVIPTVGRPTLLAALESAREADEIILVLDEAGTPGLLPILPEWPNLIVETVVGGDHGYEARTHGMAVATGTHLAFMDDDDAYRDGALDLMREHACQVPVIFRMSHPDLGVLWRDQHLAFGNVSTQMFLVPNQPGLGEWKAHAPGLPQPGGDYTFIRGSCDRMGGPVWRDEVIADIRPALVAA